MPNSSYDGPTLDEAQLAFLRGVDSPTVANAIEPFKVRDRVEGYLGGNLRCLFPELPTLVGHALTVTVTNRPGPIMGRATWWAMWEALEAMPKPSVLVMQDLSGLPHRIAYCGEMMATYASRLGAVGLVTDGGVRDLNEVRALGFHYFAPFPVVSHGNFGVVEIGAPVTLDGQVVRTGDILHGDANGVVIVPPEVLSDLPAEVERIRDRERRSMEFVRSPEFSLAKAKEQAAY